MRVVGRASIEEALARIDVLESIAQGFVAYSSDRAVVPPVGELVFEEPPGDVHIKYGYLRGDEFFVIKIASGYYENPKLGLPSGNGMMLLFRQRTGEPAAVLLDEGYLTDVRTAAAGALAARHLAPDPVRGIGVLGCGVQARLQAEWLRAVTDCRRISVWGRRAERIDAYREEMAARGFEVQAAADPSEVAASCNLIVTTTPATEPLLNEAAVRPGTHITAVGSDTPAKQELDPAILARADLVVADSRSQCLVRGEIAHAVRAGLLDQQRLVELGEVIAGTAAGRSSGDQITVADLTGVAVQDIQIAAAVYRALPPE